MVVKRLLVAASAIALISMAAPARADDPTDALFLHALNEAGIEYHDPQQAIEAGRAVCGYLAEGNTVDQTVRGVKNANPNLSMTMAAEFVGLARETYCGPPPSRGSG